MPLIRGGQVVEDPWHDVADDASLPATGGVIVSLSRLRAERDALMNRAQPLGVRLKSSERASDIEAELPGLQLVALEFPTFRDGRAYSTARRLREQLGFTGEIRAVGNVLRDQLLFMQRCGIDTFELESDHAAADFQQAITEISVFYQPTGDGRSPVWTLRSRKRATA